MKDWERTVNALMVDTEADIYIKGSNAHLLSTDLSTYLTGRYVEVRMLPLSFSEYLELREMKGILKKCSESISSMEDSRDWIRHLERISHLQYLTTCIHP